MGLICFSPLAQGMLQKNTLTVSQLTAVWQETEDFSMHQTLLRKRSKRLRSWDALAKERGQSLPQMALSWLLKDSDVTSVLIGASKPEQILSNIGIVGHTTFAKEELDLIDQISKEQ